MIGPISALVATTQAQFCPSGSLDLNGGTPCNNDAFCARFDPRYRCMNGYCCRKTGPICTMPNQQVERESGVVKNCMYQPCSVGFGCEYSRAMGQYICCGSYSANNDYTYGKVRMYPGTTMPLQCFKEDQCLWVDTPNCVYSYRYRQKVCCSTFNC
ncbi:hypothetical protein TELCIR_08181 [Teladorsagia circumcincta]|uniref:EB module n=1 Tax=Teladorsagia circumcincta TaxID=45464 RepID=A0A2G9UI98_TELCI|nr:hypothetical protein TELCIR_08181 [Teladorsagia circumcincta]